MFDFAVRALLVSCAFVVFAQSFTLSALGNMARHFVDAA